MRLSWPIADPDVETARARAEACGVPAVYASAEAMLEQEQLDVVDVASPRETHAPNLPAGRGPRSRDHLPEAARADVRRGRGTGRGRRWPRATDGARELALSAPLPARRRMAARRSASVDSHGDDDAAHIRTDRRGVRARAGDRPPAHVRHARAAARHGGAHPSRGHAPLSARAADASRRRHWTLVPRWCAARIARRCS